MAKKTHIRILDTLVKRIGTGFAFMVSVLVIIVLATSQKVRDTVEISERIQNTRSPTALASLSALNGVNHSLASLRGWMLLGAPRFRQARQDAWEKQIDPAIEQMRSLSHGWTNAANLERLKGVMLRLPNLRAYQQEIEDIAQTIEATPATEILLVQAVPLATTTSNLITRIIELEKQQAASAKRKKLFAAFADFRGSMGLSVAAIRAYLLVGNLEFQDQYEVQWAINTAAVAVIEKNVDILTPIQRTLFEQLADANSRFATLAAKMFEIRASEQWNLANYWLATLAVPVSFEIQNLLQEMAQDQRGMMTNDFAVNTSQIVLLQRFLWLLLIIGVAAAIIISIYTIRTIAGHLDKVILAADAIAIGDLDISIASTGIREFDALSQSMQKIVGNLREVATQADIIAQGDYDVTVEPLSDADKLGNSLVRMTGNLRELDAERQLQLWLTNGFTTLASIMEGDQSLIDLSTAVIKTLCELIDAQVGALYVLDEDMLCLAGTYAYVSRKNLSNRWKIGEGLVGQAALKKQAIVICNVPDDYIHISSGLGETFPRHIMVSPLLYEGKVLGVVEIGSVTAISDRGVKLLNQVSSRIAIAYASAAARDTLMRRQTELTESEEKMRAMIETAVDSIIMIDDNGTIQSINSSTTKLFGYESEELIGNNIKMLMPSPYHEEHDGYIAHYRKTGVKKIIGNGREVCGVRKNGTEFPVFLSVGELKLGNKKLYSGFIKDITLQKEAETEIKNQNQQLQTQTEELQTQTEELQTQKEELIASYEKLEEQTRLLQASEEDLQQSNEELEKNLNQLQKRKIEIEEQNRIVEAARMELQTKAQELALTSKYKSQFLANMSHELRTPLNSLLILSQQLAENSDDNLTEKQVEYAEIINSSGKDLLGLIESILDLAKIEAGKMDVHATGIQFSEIVGNLQQGFEQIAKKATLKFSLKMDNALPPKLVTDEKRLHQILRNLLSNAFKFTKKGSVTLDVSVVAEGQWPTTNESLNRAGQIIAFTVTDTGIGIAKDKQALIFEAFQQAEGGINREYGGTGLGLSISRELAQLLGGEIKLQSTPGRGSVFTLYLPQTYSEPAVISSPEIALAKDHSTEVAEQDVVPVKAPYEDTTTVPDHRDTIKPGDRVLLIIEDDPVLAKILLDLAWKKNFKGVVSLAGNPGLALARKLKPDGITLDLRLPDCNGWVILDALKNDPQTSHIPVHIISADDEHEQQGLERGAFAYLKKSANPAQISTALENLKVFTDRGKRRLLVVEGDPSQRKAMVKLIGNTDVEITAVGTGKAALAALLKQRFDCIVTELKLPDMTGVTLMKTIRKKPEFAQLPFVVYTCKEVSLAQETQLKKLAQSIIVKGSNSPERLLEETTLFLHRVASDLPKDKRKLIKQAHQLDAELQDKKVLIVDDDVRNIFSTTSILERHKMQIMTAENGKDCIDLLEKTPDVDVVLMDIMMPVMDGYEAMRKIRNKRKFKSLPIIAMTAKAMNEDRDKCIAAGASDYISKPVNADQLLSLLRVWLHQ